MKISNSDSEIRYFAKDLINLLIASFFTALLFSLFEINKFFSFLLPSFFFFFFCYCIKTIFAHYYGFKIKSRFLSLKRIWFGDKYKTKIPIPIWLILPLLMSLVTFNTIKLLTIVGYEYSETIKRVKRKYQTVEFEIAKISMASLLFIFGLFVIFHYIGFSEFASVAAWFLISNLLPFGILDGSRIFHSSWIAWSFYFVFILIALLLMNIASIFISLTFAMILALLILIFSLYKYLRIS